MAGPTEDDPSSAGDAGEASPEEVTSVQIMLERFQLGTRDASGCQSVTLVTDLGEIDAHYHTPQIGHDQSGPDSSPQDDNGHAVRPCVPGAVFVGGLGGAAEVGPQGGGLYARLCEGLSPHGVAGLRLGYRRPGDFEHCVLDVLAALAFLDEQDVGPVALVGHGFGGAVVIHAALLSPAVVTCVPLATTPYGADEAEYLAPRCSVLLAHGTRDDVVPADVSRHVFDVASEPKHLLLIDGAGHDLQDPTGVLPRVLREWLLAELRRAGQTWQP